MNNKHLPKNATFFISTGRCGTQWFAEKLSAHYNDVAFVTHEPFQAEYEPRLYFRQYHRQQLVSVSQPIQSHLDGIKKTLQDRHYIETGWPVYGVLPFILSRYKGRVKVVHLFRHPLKVAASLVTHRVYSREGWSDAVGICPSDYGVAQDHLRGKRWKSMSEFEKCLFWSTEINHFAFSLKQTFSDIPWLSIRFEEVFSESGRTELAKLLDFLSLPERESFFQSRMDKTDKFSLKIDDKLDVRRVRKYPIAVEEMKRLGYKYNSRIGREIKRHYTLRASIRDDGYRIGVRRSLERNDSILFRVIPNLFANCLRLGIYKILGNSDKACKTERRIMKYWGYLMGKLRYPTV
jgi:Sulfotransferase domain